jgi:hypothetical protein
MGEPRRKWPLNQLIRDNNALTDTKAASRGPTGIRTGFSVCMSWLLPWCFCGTFNSRRGCISDLLSPLGVLSLLLGCPVQLIVSCSAMIGSLLEVCSSLMESKEELIGERRGGWEGRGGGADRGEEGGLGGERRGAGRGEEGGLGGERRGGWEGCCGSDVLYERRIYFQLKFFSKK